ncbi:nitrous oxide reductase family maturation protein NosD [Streptomyces sp. TRM68416]|uniref:right-handed parallel beta-helix repeat-containing protein n=1 Tax=Streptomyces sp. TRM68416 TaxID=2758412 RepID=UPI0016620B44|nr:right-handed parallel beta-helix repeat-containing protein [Streptomyces sp. TRM68416]MBD0840019.1 right-handed parallel beta-helix repeat-containing protein [Streptomyces sp. TRM68416]
MLTNRFRAFRFVLGAVLLAATASCASGATGSGGPGGGAAVVRVPQQTPSLQEAVDRVRPGGLVLVSPGVYRESVRVTTPRVVLRGTDRSRVVVDGEFRRANGITVTGPGSAVENLTVRNHLANGLLFTGVTDERLQAGGAGGSAYDPLDTAEFPPLKGFRASYITAHNNALYGIYAFDARSGVIERSYASGHADSGIYVGQCRPCDTVVRHNTVEHNAVGLEVTNASERLYLLGNRAVRNRVGLALNSNDMEALGPQHDAVVVGNALVDNNDDRSPEQADGGFGIGIGAGGVRDNLFARNLVTGNRAAGIVLSDVQGYPSTRNTVRDNRVTANGTDLVLATGAVSGNCFSDNGDSRTSPARLPDAARQCATSSEATPTSEVPPPPLGGVRPLRVPPGISFQDAPRPPAQPSLPAPASAPHRPAVSLPGRVDPGDYPLPASADAVGR